MLPLYLQIGSDNMGVGTSPDPLSCMAYDNHQYLQEMLELNKSPLTLRGMVAAIKEAHVGPLKLTEGCCDLIAQSLKGACGVAPYRRRSALL